LNRLILVLLAVIPPLWISGCAHELSDPRFVEPEGSKQYVAGYRHGCQSGRHEAQRELFFHIQDHDRYESNSEYTQGWDEGFALCFEQQEENPVMMGGSGGGL